MGVVALTVTPSVNSRSNTSSTPTQHWPILDDWDWNTNDGGELGGVDPTLARSICAVPPVGMLSWIA
jgi:hypothetical protein